MIKNQRKICERYERYIPSRISDVNGFGRKGLGGFDEQNGG